MDKYEYQAFCIEDSVRVHGVREEIIAKNQQAAVTKAWSRAVRHLAIGENATICMDYVRYVK
jgi:hypothetical protein